MTASSAGYFREPEMTRTACDDEGFFRTGNLFTIADTGAL